MEAESSGVPNRMPWKMQVSIHVYLVPHWNLVPAWFKFGCVTAPASERPQALLTNHLQRRESEVRVRVLSHRMLAWRDPYSKFSLYSEKPRVSIMTPPPCLFPRFIMSSYRSPSLRWCRRIWKGECAYQSTCRASRSKKATAPEEEFQRKGHR